MGGQKIIKYIEANKGLKNLDLTDNDLRDDFASGLLNALKNNTEIMVIKLGGNPIEIKRVRAIDELLERNRDLAAKRKVPTYQRELNRYKPDTRVEFSQAASQIEDTKKQLVVEKKENAIYEKKLQETIDKERAMTKLIEIKQKNIDKLSLKADENIKKSEHLLEEEKIKCEAQIKEIHHKIEHTIKNMEVIQFQSIFLIIL